MQWLWNIGPTQAHLRNAGREGVCSLIWHSTITIIEFLHHWIPRVAHCLHSPHSNYYTPQYTAIDDGNGNMVDVLIAYDVLVDANRNPTEAGGSERADTLYATTANDHLQGIGGIDILTANGSHNGGNDMLSGNDGNDTLIATYLRRNKTSGARCAVLFERSKCDVANDSAWRVAA